MDWKKTRAVLDGKRGLVVPRHINMRNLPNIAFIKTTKVTLSQSIKLFEILAK